ncbi:MAG: YchJ family protein [Halofilum sp. (in: g-proteobacteria)]|nr:YchJ family protein [Halofilum sp. (in: g-proteobacteria)]
MSECPCGSGRDHDDCCGPFLAGTDRPATAAALMRARYTAHTRADLDYIEATHDPETRADIDREATERWARRAEWLGLEILETVEGGPGDEVGAVEFVAHYRERGARQRHHELARFKRDADGAWVYVDGEAPETGTVRREGPRVGRNDACPCGSGRKYKKCCGAAA